MKRNMINVFFVLYFSVSFNSDICASENKDLLINKKGELFFYGLQDWSSGRFLEKGYKIEKDHEYYVGEGELSDTPEKYYYINVKYDKEYIFSISVVDGLIYEISTQSPSVLLAINTDNKKYIHVGMNIHKVISKFDAYDYWYGEGPGLYFKSDDIPNIYLYSKCDPSTLIQEPPYYVTESATINYLIKNNCVINKITAVGDKGKIWK